MTLNPGNAPEPANKVKNYTPGLMRVHISDTKSSEEIDLVRGIYDDIDFTTSSASWYTSRIDPSTNTTWIKDEYQNVDFFIAERAFQIGSNVDKH